MRPTYTTDTGLGRCFNTTAEVFLASGAGQSLAGRVDLIFTSPPFLLNKKKKYGNKQGQEYVEWLADFAPLFSQMLKPQGSIVIEMGNAWEPRSPVMSTLALEALLEFKRRGALYLCQQFIWNNVARLPAPAQWVNIERIRVKDAFTHLWWLSPTERPKADNRRVLKPYSKSMETLLRTRKYNSGKRPSEHKVGATSFLQNNQGAIPSNVISAANTQAATDYLNYCRIHGLPIHPARMPMQVAEFFISFLTDQGDMVFDPFAGSNTTGAAAEKLGRVWVATEPNVGYVSGSRGRFTNALADDDLDESPA